MYFLEITFTFETESFGTSDSQWRDLAKNTFIVYAGGHFVESRPRASFDSPTLTVPFSNRAEFLDFLFQARSLSPTRLVGFRVLSREPRRVICISSHNYTPAIRVTGDTSDLPEGESVIIQM